jgi:hypothetical protein
MCQISELAADTLPCSFANTEWVSAMQKVIALSIATTPIPFILATGH